MRIALLLSVVMLSSCTCGPVDEPPNENAFGFIRVNVSNDTATLTLSQLRRPLRSLQVDVDVSGGRASAFSATGAHNLVEAGLDDGPKAQLTAVVADTRRLPIFDGAFARITVDAGADVTLRNAVAVDDTGAKQTIVVAGAP